MKRLMFFFVLLTCTIGLFTGCGVSKRTLADAEQRIEALKSKGVPDSSLSEARVLLYQARKANEKSIWGEARKAGKSLAIELAKAEALYRENIARLKPETDSLLNVISGARDNYSGMELRKYDSLAGIVDSFAGIDWILQANAKAKELIDLMPQLTFDNERSQELRPRIPGIWASTQKTKSTENRDVNAVETKTFTFNKDGSAKLVEKKKGQSGPFLKEDWEFLSTGNWDINGDTIHLFIDRFASVRQMFERLHIEDGGAKRTWKKEPAPTYDSAITDGSQNRFVTFADLKEDFRQTKKF